MTKEYTTSMETEQLTYYSSFNTYTNTAIPVANVFQDIWQADLRNSISY
jgi:hypothetical protein